MNWDQVIIKAIVPISFLAIWALTALFNKESQGFPARPPGPSPGNGPRPGDPSMRWTPPSGSSSNNSKPRPDPNRRMPMEAEDILMIPGEPGRPARPAMTKPPQGVLGLRRPVKGRPAPVAAKKPEPGPARARLLGVSQNVNQSLARPIELTPLTTIAPMATTSGSELANAPSAPSVTSAVLTVSTLLPLMNDPIRLRESFIVNELFQAPVALRGRRGHRR